METRWKVEAGVQGVNEAAKICGVDHFRISERVGEEIYQGTDSPRVGIHNWSMNSIAASMGCNRAFNSVWSITAKTSFTLRMTL